MQLPPFKHARKQIAKNSNKAMIPNHERLKYTFITAISSPSLPTVTVYWLLILITLPINALWDTSYIPVKMKVMVSYAYIPCTCVDI